MLELSKSKKSDRNDTFKVSEVYGNSSDNFIDDDTLEDSSNSDSDMYTKLLNDKEDYNTIINKLKRNTEKDRENSMRSITNISLKYILALILHCMSMEKEGLKEIWP